MPVLGSHRNKKSRRGFAVMDPERQREIASMGGKATGGRNLTREARVRGGRNSRRNRRKK